MRKFLSITVACFLLTFTLLTTYASCASISVPGGHANTSVTLYVRGDNTEPEEPPYTGGTGAMIARIVGVTALVGSGIFLIKAHYTKK